MIRSTPFRRATGSRIPLFTGRRMPYAHDESPKQFLHKVAHLLNELIPGTETFFIHFVTDVLQSIVMKHRKSSSRNSARKHAIHKNTQKKSGGYRWRSKKSTHSASRRRQFGGNFHYSQYDHNAVKCLIICILSLVIIIFTGKNIHFPVIPAHNALLTDNITVTSVIEHMSTYANMSDMNYLSTYANMSDIFQIPEISASIARLYGSFAEISKRKEFQQNKAKSNPDVLNYTPCDAQQNPIIDFIDFTRVSVLREENYCRNSNHASFEICMNALFRPNNNASDLSVSFTKPILSAEYDKDMKNFIKMFKENLEKMIEEYKMNESQYNRARNPDISRWNHVCFFTFITIFSISALNLNENWRKSIEESTDRVDKSNKRIKEIKEKFKKTYGI
jgi:hypothetical protein